jgi:hypothetical protein
MITLNKRPSPRIHNTEGNQLLLTYTQDLHLGAHNTKGGINIYQLQLGAHNMKQNQDFLIFWKDTKRRTIEQEREKWANWAREGASEAQKVVIGRCMGRMDQLSNSCEGDEKPRP